jgi:magnesium chelatase subunit H
VNVTVLYVGSSLLAPLKIAEREINREYHLGLRVAAYNFGSPLDQTEWAQVNHDLREADIVFIIHVMDGENAARLVAALERYQKRHHAVVVINCMPELMRRTRMGRLDVSRLAGTASDGEKGRQGDGETRDRGEERGTQSSRTWHLLRSVGSWVGKQTRPSSANGEPGKRGHSRDQYLKLIDRLPSVLRFIPTAGTLRDIKHYLYLFCYFLQPTPTNIRSMLLYTLKYYMPEDQLRKVSINIPQPERMPSVAIYHGDAPSLFQSFEAYKKWYVPRAKKINLFGRASDASGNGGPTCTPLDPHRTIGLLLMRPQVVSRTTKHYDLLIRAIEAEGLSVIPAIATLMDNRQACEKFFIAEGRPKGQSPKPKAQTTGDEPLTADERQSRVSQIVSLTGFSFVGGPAMNDSLAASEFLCNLNRPYRSAVSLDRQTIESWRDSQTGLNPVQAGMQIAIPEIDGATEPFVYGGIPARGVEPVALADRCRRFARRLKRWNHLRTSARSEIRLAMILFCFPPNKGNIGTAADLDVFPSVWDTLNKLKADGYNVAVPSSPDELRNMLLSGNAERFGAIANVAYRLSVEEYRRLCPYVTEIENEWGPAPGRIGSFAGDLLIQGLTLGNVFIGVQPTFGFEGDPMRLMMARGGAPHHGFMAFYTYLAGVLDADAVIHVGTHGAMEFMPGKQVGLSDECWPDRLIGDLPNVYLYSVNNPSEGSIAKRRSYAQLISYLTPPIENAGLYRGLASLKELLLAYRQATDELERDRLYGSIEECSRSLNFAMAPLRIT